MMDKKVEGKVFMKGGVLKDMLNTFKDTDCGADCQVKLRMDGNQVDIAIRECNKHTPCFIAMLQSMGTLH